MVLLKLYCPVEQAALAGVQQEFLTLITAGLFVKV